MKNKYIRTFEENSSEEDKYDIKFTNDIEQVKELLLSLNNDDDEDFSVKEIGNNKFEIIYNGGYNNVYNYKSIVEIDGMVNNMHDKFFYWKFNVTSPYNDDTYELDNFGWDTGFMDFFIDDHIRTVGNIKANEDESLGNTTFESNTNNLIDVIKNIPQQEQVQYDLKQQMEELRIAANKLGLYDAADYIRENFQ